MNKTMLPEGNLLQYEKSPYLLQHAGDPVDWRPWCPGALMEASSPSATPPATGVM